MGFEPVTPTLPRLCATPAPRGHCGYADEALVGCARRRTGGQWRIRTSEGVSQLIYSQSRLATSVTAQMGLTTSEWRGVGADGQN